VRNSGSRGHRPAGEEAGSAKDRATLRRIKGHRRLFAALGAGHSYLNALLDSGRLGRGDRRQPIILRMFAGLASFGFVLQTFIVKEDLFAGRPNEWLAAIDACDRSVLKVRRRLGSDLSHPAV